LKTKSRKRRGCELLETDLRYSKREVACGWLSVASLWNQTRALGMKGQADSLSFHLRVM